MQTRTGKPHTTPLPGETFDKSTAEGGVSTPPVKRVYIGKNERRRLWRLRLNELHQQELNKKKAS